MTPWINEGIEVQADQFERPMRKGLGIVRGTSLVFAAPH
jgi:hypothetical protein